MSFLPVSEALLRLEFEGMLESRPRAGTRVRIPTREEHGSMNLGQAVAVCLYELIREDRPSSLETMPRQADAVDLDRLTALLLESARTSGYLSAQSGSSSEEKIRRLVFRLGLPADDVTVWLGMLRQSLWRMKR